MHPGHVGMFEESVQFDITTLPGIRNKLFGGDGLFLARLTGPGRIWLQTLTLSNLAGALGPYLGATEATGAAEGTLLGSLVRKAFD
ncbi:AIM24 family protein [Asaia platycodi]|uniref:AIM24 family protein n=1 Tax=Asaia platycodi TaxID=610243 RepID=UPI000A941CDC|nr:AIM24 family protein [Asaia platycodi]